MNETEMVTITDDLIEGGKSAVGGYSKAQLALLGVTWPPLRGWKKGIVGKQITKDAATRFLTDGGGKVKNP
jgi:hypothetical protein